jgi:hypothetical protein
MLMVKTFTQLNFDGADFIGFLASAILRPLILLSTWQSPKVSFAYNSLIPHSSSFWGKRAGNQIYPVLSVSSV